MIEIIKNIPLAELSTMATTGLALRVVTWETVADLEVLMSDDQYEDIRQSGIKPIGEGSNLLFMTSEYDGTLLKCVSQSISLHSEDAETAILEISAGTLLDDLVLKCCDMNLWGVENLSHIPGTVGAASVQNVGAYGVEFADVVETVNCYDLDSKSKVSFNVGDLGYGYRDSMLKRESCKGRYVVTSVIIRLSKLPTARLNYGNLAETVGAEKDDIYVVRDAVISLRRSKLPEVGVVGSAGSFFKNPIISEKEYDEVLKTSRENGFDTHNMPVYNIAGGKKLSAAWLIDKAGWKGVTIGHAGVWPQQPLVLVNADGHASGADIAALAEAISRDVEQKFGVRLEPEVEYL